MRTLSSEERDERLKYHLMASKELHPALISPESEYKVLQQLVSGVLASVLRPREAQCPVVRSIAREFVTCLVVQPLMSFASPVYLNEILELIFIAMKEDGNNLFSFGADKSTPCMPSQQDVSIHCNQVVDASSHKADDSSPNVNQDDQKQLKAGDWAMGLEAATQRRTEVLMPENLENLWSRGRNYRKKEACKVRGECEGPLLSKSTGSISNSNLLEFHTSLSQDTIEPEEKMAVRFNTNSVEEASSPVGGNFNVDDSSVNDKNLFAEDNSEHELNDTVNHDTNGEGTLLKTSSSTSTLKAQTNSEKAFTGEAGGRIMPTLHSPRLGNCNGEDKVKNEFEFNHGSQGSHTLKLSCRVMGASFEKLGSKSFAVYSIAVRDTESKTWLVKRRYSNFEQLHRYLKEIPNYTLHLPPKRIFSSSTEDAFVHQRCIQLHKYLQDVLSIANVAEQHEVWDFLSASSKNYSCGKSSSVIETLAVNVDDAVDDIFRQFKGVSNGIMRVVVGPTPSGSEYTSLITEMNLPLRANESNTNISGQNTEETSTSISDDEGGKDQNHCPKVDQMIENAPVVVNSLAGPHQWGDPNGMPPEWTPPNVLVPMLNLVDKVFQLNRRGWLRRQVFWMSKQIAQMVMEDAIDDFLLTQIHWLRREETIAQGIRWVQDILWPNGKFFISLRSIPTNVGDDAQQDGRLLNTVDSHVGSKLSSFEMHLEATRRANELKKLLFDGAPAALVSLVGHKQYRRCARDIYYFSQVISIFSFRRSWLSSFIILLYCQCSVYNLREATGLLCPRALTDIGFPRAEGPGLGHSP
ncbi:hypothetical protein SAY86_003989 [Trapa natans]|uniref:PX domain-containing protein n=1 Tax=Trapa natans TaxID=22666 RepID=A0AAN7MUF8_TRANT|nr:hypothetical protein SAY86_003989 [Trapa natans]